MPALPLFPSSAAGLRTASAKFSPVVASFPKRAALPLLAPAVAASAAIPAARSLHSSSASRSASKKDDSAPKFSNPFEGGKVDASAVVGLTNECVTKLQNASTQQLYHWSSYGLAGLAPVAMILSPSFLNFPVDFALGLIIPVHMHIGLVGVVEDYVPRSSQGAARLILAILSALTAIGLLKVNLCGAGITESVKCLWREPKEQKKIKGDKK